MKRAIIILLLLLLAFAGYKQFISKDKRLNVTDSANVSPTGSALKYPSPTGANFTVPSDWKKYESPRYGYEISYPPNWSVNFWKENDQSVSTGAHTFANYDTTKIEQFMDHGIVDWQKFIGDKIAIKFDLIVERVGDSGQNEIIDKYFKDASPQPMSNLSIGQLNTFQYNLGSEDELVRSYLAFNPDGQVIYVNVNVKNQRNQVVLEDTEEWNELRRIFSTFNYKVD